MSNKRTNNFLEEYIERPIKTISKEEAIERLIKLGILDKDGSVMGEWKDIIVNKENSTSNKIRSALLTKQVNLNEWKYYYRVVISRKDNKGPILEIAGFKDKKNADGYMRNLVQNTEGWDDDKLVVDRLLYALPPWTVPDDNLKSKINFLINLEEKENCNE